MTTAKPTSRFQLFIEQALPWGVLIVIATYTFAFFFKAPYAGFKWNSSDGQVFEIYVPTPTNLDLQSGDRLIKIGSISFADFSSDLRRTLFDGAQPGQVVPLLIQRGDDLPTTVAWVFPGFTLNELLARLLSEWWLTYTFWIAGTVTLLFLRPKDTRWWLLIAFNFLTALWLAAGGVSSSHIGESAVVLRSAVWLCLPVYLHLHWSFPQPLKHLPTFVSWFIYLIAGTLALAEWFQILPISTYYLGFILAVVGSAVLLGIHFAFRPTHRRDIRLLVMIGILALTPSIIVSIATTFAEPTNFATGAAVSALLALPFSYLYAIYRRRLSELELRANRLISLYLFFILLSVVFITLMSSAKSWLGFPGAISYVGLAAALITLVAIFSFKPFQRFIERHLLGMPWPQEQLSETYAARITTGLNDAHLVRLLTEDMLPTLLVRESALLRYNENRFSVVYLQNLETLQLPTDTDLLTLKAQAGKYRPPDEGDCLYPWARLILPLLIESELVGLWLLGHRDPDDFYTQREIMTLQALAHQTAIALTHITYAERLLALYQTSIDQREAERTSLGRELHDDILQQLFILQQNAAKDLDTQPLVKDYEAVSHNLRHLIRGLRPPMLEYGLYWALATLADDWAHRPDAKSGPEILLAMPKTEARYNPHIEQHLYRIVQQAGENALRHAQAGVLKISACLEPGQIKLTIEDDGIGFEAEKLLDLTQPESRDHFGLIGMQERAALIKAEIKFDSVIGRGTRIHLKWSPEC